MRYFEVFLSFPQVADLAMDVSLINTPIIFSSLWMDVKS